MLIAGAYGTVSGPFKSAVVFWEANTPAETQFRNARLSSCVLEGRRSSPLVALKFPSRSTLSVPEESSPLSNAISSLNLLDRRGVAR
jgi:hypothetical protein